MPSDFDRRPRIRRSRRRSRNNDSTLVALIVAGAALLTCVGVAAFALTWQRRPAAALPVAVAPAAFPAMVTLPVPPAVPAAVAPPAVPPAVVPAPVQRPQLPKGWIDWQPSNKLFSVYVPVRPMPARKEHLSEQIDMWFGITGLTGGSAWQLGLLVLTASPEEVAALPAFLDALGVGFSGKDAVTKKITWAGLEATESVSTHPDGSMNYCRVCQFGNRMFIALDKGNPDEQEREAYFNSFVIKPK